MAPGGRAASAWNPWLRAVVLFSLWVAGATAAHTAPLSRDLTCPAGQTIWLRGNAVPHLALLARFAGVAVGGGNAGADGTWAVPLTVRERPGIYPVVVEERAAQTVVAAFTCYVDLPVGATPTTTSTMTPAASRADETAPPPAPPTLPVALSTPRATAVPPPTAAPEPTATHVAPGAPTAAPAATPEPPLPAPSSPAAAFGIVIVAVQPDDLDDPELFEYVLVENQSPTPQTLVGWRLVHAATGGTYTFSAVTLGAGEQLVVWSGEGEDDQATGARFWPATAARWTAGDTAELHTADGQIVSTLLVTAPAGDEE